MRIAQHSHGDTDLADLHTTAARRLAAAGQRYTSSRRALVEVLTHTDRPLTLPEILACDESLSQSSAYRNLSELIAAAVVSRVVTAEEHGRFELAQDLTEHHHHLVCTRCGRVDDFTVSAEMEAGLDVALERIATDRGFTTTHHQLDLIGTCQSCR